MQVFVLRKYQLGGCWKNCGVVNDIDKVKHWVEKDKANRNFDEFDLDLSDLTEEHKYDEL